jgi:hypothetical protein
VPPPFCPSFLHPSPGPGPPAQSRPKGGVNSSEGESDSTASVWRVGDRRWNEQFEQLYSRWVETEVDVDFLERFQLRADCADTSAMLRAVFARIHQLPILYKNGGTRPAIGHFSTRFARIPTVAPGDEWTPVNWKSQLMKDQRFRAFLNAPPDQVSVQNAPENTFPVEVYDPLDRNKPSKYLRAGILHSRSNHIKIISSVDPNRWFSIRQLSATTPAAIQRLTEYDAELDEQKTPGRGLLAYNWVVYCGKTLGWQHVPDEMMPGYSQQQYSFELPKELRDRKHHLGSHLERIARSPQVETPPPDTLEKELLALSNHLSTRVRIVHGGRALTQSRQLSASEWKKIDDLYSTPGMDKGLVRRLEKLEKLIQEQSRTLGLTRTDVIRIASTMPVQIGIEDLETTVYFFVKGMREGAISSDARAQLEDRWGVAWLQALASRSV